ncbi:unnamed protein product, partial [marine sediment metagenome]
MFDSLPLYNDSYEIFSINYNDHYTGLLYFAPWLRNKMNEYGYETPLQVGDACAALSIRNVFADLPPYYPDENNNSIEDIIEILENPTYPDYESSKKLYFADQSSLISKKAVIALYTGQHFFSLQPSYDPEHWDQLHWFHAGLIETKEYYENGQNVFKALKPSYYTYKLFIDKVVGAGREIEKLDLGKHVYAFRLVKDNKPLIFIWHENIFDVDAKTGLVRRNQRKTVDLSQYISTPNG